MENLDTSKVIEYVLNEHKIIVTSFFNANWCQDEHYYNSIILPLYKWITRCKLVTGKFGCELYLSGGRYCANESDVPCITLTNADYDIKIPKELRNVTFSTSFSSNIIPHKLIITDPESLLNTDFTYKCILDCIDKNVIHLTLKLCIKISHWLKSKIKKITALNNTILQLKNNNSIEAKGRLASAHNEIRRIWNTSQLILIVIFLDKYETLLIDELTNKKEKEQKKICYESEHKKHIREQYINKLNKIIVKVNMSMEIITGVLYELNRVFILGVTWGDFDKESLLECISSINTVLNITEKLVQIEEH